MIKNDKIPELERASEAELPTFATSGQYKAHARVILQYTSFARAVIEWVYFLVEKKFKRHVSFIIS